MKIYRTSKYSTHITEYELVKQTDVSVYIKNYLGEIDRKDKLSYTENFHRTRQEAEKYIIARLTNEIEECERQAAILGDELTDFLESINKDS